MFMRFFGIIIFVAFSIFLTTMALAQECPDGQSWVFYDVYGVNGDGSGFCAPIGDWPADIYPSDYDPPAEPNTPPTPTPTPPPPNFSEESGSWSDDGLSISWGNPQDLVSTGDDLSDGKAYQVPRYTTVLPGEGRGLYVMDRPGGNVLGTYSNGEANLRIKYYYVDEQDGSIWAGVCQNRKNCGWAAADYLVALPKGAELLGMYSINAMVSMVYSQPSFNSNIEGELYDLDLVAVTNERYVDGTNWAQICRLKICDVWVPFEDLIYEF